MDIKDIRHHHFMVAWHEYRENQSMSDAIAARLAAAGESGTVSAGYISQLKNRTRDIGHSTARKLEIGLGKPPLSFDNIDAGLLREQIRAGILTFSDEEARELAMEILGKHGQRP